MFDNPTDNHTDIEVPLYYELRFTKLKNLALAYTKFYSPSPVFHLPAQIFTPIGERASVSFPAWGIISMLAQTTALSSTMISESLLHLHVFGYFDETYT